MENKKYAPPWIPELENITDLKYFYTSGCSGLESSEEYHMS